MSSYHQGTRGLSVLLGVVSIEILTVSSIREVNFATSDFILIVEGKNKE